MRVSYKYRRYFFVAIFLIIVATRFFGDKKSASQKTTPTTQHFFDDQRLSDENIVTVSTTPTAKLLKVNDGDTVTIDGFGRCRIMGIDTPEIWQMVNGEWVEIANPEPNAFKAKEWLEKFLDQDVQITLHRKDKYDRWLIDLRLPNNIDAATYIRQQGWEKKNKRGE